METFLEAKQEGKIRFTGFSAHSEEAAMVLKGIPLFKV
jgi:predicted aldo/keto reductase-like oxidoreductase